MGQSDEALQCIVNAECPIRHLTFFGYVGQDPSVTRDLYELLDVLFLCLLTKSAVVLARLCRVVVSPGLDGLSVLTGTDGLSLWHWPTARRVADLGDVRTMSQAWVSETTRRAFSDNSSLPSLLRTECRGGGGTELRVDGVATC